MKAHLGNRPDVGISIKQKAVVQRSLEEPFTNKHNLGGFLLSNARPALINQNYMLPSPGIGKQKLVWVTQLQDTHARTALAALLPLNGQAPHTTPWIFNQIFQNNNLQKELQPSQET